MEGYSFSAAFLSGLLGTAHCLGMCSGINAGYFASRGVKVGLSPLLSYHLTRITMYTILGVAGAVVGRLVMQSGIVGKVQGIVMMIAGIWIVFMGARLLWKQKAKAATELNPKPVIFIADPINQKTPFFAGLLNGLIPCGLVTTVAIQAAASADPVRAAGLMLVFGLGTLPAMMLLSTVGNAGGIFGRALKLVLALAILALGAWTFYQGAVFFNVIRGLGNW